LSLLEAKDTERVVRQILNQLPERDRRLLQSVLLEERNKDEVCAEFGITREYLRVLLHRARQKFRDRSFGKFRDRSFGKFRDIHDR
jgi:RNA polymerase sigma-70 factor, ECF subfamily